MIEGGECGEDMAALLCGDPWKTRLMCFALSFSRSSLVLEPLLKSCYSSTIQYVRAEISVAASSLKRLSIVVKSPRRREGIGMHTLCASPERLVGVV